MREGSIVSRYEKLIWALSASPFLLADAAGSDTRELALAWAFLEQTGARDGKSEAQPLLRTALSQSPNDPILLSTLGYIEQKHGKVDVALELYQKALALDPDLVDAAANLAVIEANQGRLREPIRLWQSVFDRAPARSAIGMNIAKVLCGAGEFARARSSVIRVLAFNPDMAAARHLLQNLDRRPPVCEL